MDFIASIVLVIVWGLFSGALICLGLMMFGFGFGCWMLKSARDVDNTPIGLMAAGLVNGIFGGVAFYYLVTFFHVFLK